VVLVRSVAAEDKRDRPARLETTEPLESPEHPVNLAPPDRRLFKPATKSRPRLAILVLLDPPDLPANLVNPETKDRTDIPEATVDRRNPAPLDQRARRVHQEILDNPELLDRPALLLNHPTLDLVSQDPPVQLDLPDLPDQPGNLEAPAVKDNPALRDLTVNPAIQATTVNLEPPEEQESQEVLARREFVPNTARSMEESSSRTELVDDKHLARVFEQAEPISAFTGHLLYFFQTAISTLLDKTRVLSRKRSLVSGQFQ